MQLYGLLKGFLFFTLNFKHSTNFLVLQELKKFFELKSNFRSNEVIRKEIPQYINLATKALPVVFFIFSMPARDKIFLFVVVAFGEKMVSVSRAHTNLRGIATLVLVESQRGYNRGCMHRRD